MSASRATMANTADHSPAAEKCQQEKRKTVNGEDILFAMTSLGFENYGEALKIYLARYREVRRSPPTLSLALTPDTPCTPQSNLAKIENQRDRPSSSYTNSARPATATSAQQTGTTAAPEGGAAAASLGLDLPADGEDAAAFDYTDVAEGAGVEF